MSTKGKRTEKGFTSIEVALIVPFLLFVLLLLTQLILLVMAKTTAQAVAEEAAEESAHYGNTNADGYQTADQAAKQIPGLHTVDVNILRNSNNVVVEVTGKPLQLLPINMRVEAKASSPIEKIIAEDQR